MVITRDSTLEKTLNTLYKPDDLLETTAITYQMSTVTFDAINPFYMQGGYSASTTTYVLPGRVTVLQSTLFPVPN